MRPLALLCLCIVCCSKPAAQAPLRIAAAADLQGAFTELGKELERSTGRRVDISFGSSGLLAKQLEEGAPFDLFAAANASFVDRAVRAGACDGASKVIYARGQIVVWTPKAVAPPRTLADLSEPRFRKIALANPEHAPYGMAARQALTRAGIWSVLTPRLVYGENVQQALQFARTGNADAALVALSLALSAPEGTSMPVGLDQYQALDQALVVCTRGKATSAAREFAALLASDRGQEVLRHFGFLLDTQPGGAKTLPGTPGNEVVR